MFYLRLFGFTLLRYVAILILVLFVQNFEVSPLPEWTLTLFAYVMHFLITMGLTYWLFRRRLMTIGRIIAVAVAFIILTTMLETWLYLLIIQGDSRDIWANFSWRSLPLVFTYLAAIGAAIAVRRRKERSAASLPQAPAGLS